ncbi:MAG TPA: hypothetical protein VGO73_14490 [Pyrinomonadaceae bacterium]|jgi:carbonic anhydrase/acetyltransferase-like protein (isoleucine patch superfamily)|nr:hypothetical protein [Pyrinomonadaceae bacterium]
MKQSPAIWRRRFANNLFFVPLLALLLLFGFIVQPRKGAAETGAASFIDPTAAIQCGPPNNDCKFGASVYIAPFATIKAGARSATGAADFITIGNDSNVQDNTLIDASAGNQPISIGEKVIIAHGATVLGGAKIGTTGTCPPGVPNPCPSFVGFNAEIAQDAVVEKYAMVSPLARVGRGVTIRSTRKVLPGKNVTTQAEADGNEKTVLMVPADLKFMNEVIHVNVALAHGYAAMAARDASSVRGINYNPKTDLNPTPRLPTIAGRQQAIPDNPNRVIGDARSANPLRSNKRNSAFAFSQARMLSMRADEGTPFMIGLIGTLDSRVTFHALEHCKLMLGSGNYGRSSIMHGGTSFNKITSTGNNFSLGENAVFFNSKAGANAVVGTMSLVEGCDLTAAREMRVVPPFTVRACAPDNTYRDYPVEWRRP